MPIIWRYLLKKIFSIFILSIFSFIIILLITQTHAIARFAILSPSLSSVALFVGCQVPYILPIAIPLSCLISTFITMKNLSVQHEITAFRALGLNLRTLLMPPLLLGLFFSCVNFMIAAELTPRTRKVAQKLIFSSTMDNPLFLIQNSNKLGMEDSIIDMKTENRGKTAKDVTFATINKNTGHIFLSKIDQLALKKDQLTGKNMTLLTYLEADHEAPFDPLFIENQKSIAFSADFLCNLLETKQYRDEPKHWELGSLIHYIKKGSEGQSERKQKAFFEIERRSFYAIITLLLTWMGSVLGITINRSESKKQLVLITLYTLTTFIFAILAKSFSQNALLSTLFFALPILIVVMGMLHAQQKILRGQV